MMSFEKCWLVCSRPRKVFRAAGRTLLFLCQTSEVKKEKENDANNTGNPENELLKRWNETEAYTVCNSEKTTKRSRKLVVQP